MNLAQTAPNLDADLEAALGAAGLSTRSARLDENLLRLFRQGEFATPFYHAISENPWRLPFFAETLRRELAAQAGRPSDAIMTLGRLIGHGSRRTLLGNPIAAQEERAKQAGSFAAAIQELRKEGLLRSATPTLAQVPDEVQQAAALIVFQLLEARRSRRLAFSRLDAPAVYAAFARPKGGVEGEAERDRIAGSLDLRHLLAGAHDLMLAVQSAQVVCATVSESRRYDFSLETAWGMIRLTGGSDTRHPDEATLLIIDTGGNDTYVGGPRNAGANNWASVVIDQSGDDRYLAVEGLGAAKVAAFDARKGEAQPGPAGALCGYAFLIDARGDDLYRSHRYGLGAAKLGAAVLLDKSGNDTYDGYRDSLGYGEYGVGVLEDVLGSDTYEGFNQVQGVGQTMGGGLLADREGSDTYRANDEVIDFPSPQSAQHNVSMSQGAGNGRRSDYTTGHSLAGGIGILYDGGGDDQYSCGVFGQGVGYWMGVGLLFDSSGHDRYLGQWYAQGASAHFAIGYLEDEAGDDTYTAPMNMAQGAGHDFSVGGLVDRAGDDKYVAPNLSLGAGNANGIGFLLEFGGNDTYASSGWTLGKGAEAPKGSMRTRALCLGLFIDFGGNDTYPAQATWAKNGSRTANWTDRGPTPAESQLGVFWDR